MKVYAWIALCLILCLSASAQVKVKDFIERKSSVHDLSESLGIKTYGGKFKTDKPFKGIGVGFKFFKNGNPEPVYKSHPISWQPWGEHSSGEVSIKIMDLDYLMIKDAPTNSLRISFSIGAKNAATWDSIDINKDLFDLKGGLSSQYCYKTDGEIFDVPIPLLHLENVKGNNISLISATTLTKLLEVNPKADIMVIYLLFDDDIVNF